MSAIGRDWEKELHEDRKHSYKNLEGEAEI
jgi:hypothetical protein